MFWMQIGEHRWAFGVLKDMRRRRMALEERTFCSLLNACAKAEDLPAAEKVFGMMADAGVQPNVQVYTSLIDAYVKDGADASLDRAFQVRKARQRNSPARLKSLDVVAVYQQ